MKYEQPRLQSEEVFVDPESLQSNNYHHTNSETFYSSLDSEE